MSQIYQSDRVGSGKDFFGESEKKSSGKSCSK